MFKYKDITAAFVIFLIALALVICPMVYSFFNKPPIYITPFQLGKYRLLMNEKNAKKERNNDGDDPFKSKKTATNIQEKLRELIKKFPAQEEFLNALLSISRSPVLDVVNAGEGFYLSIEKRPLPTVFLIMNMIYEMDDHGFDLPKIQDYIYKLFDVKGYKQKHGENAYIGSLFKEKLFEMFPVSREGFEEYIREQERRLRSHA